jgi:hypothetical protein
MLWFSSHRKTQQTGSPFSRSTMRSAFAEPRLLLKFMGLCLMAAVLGGTSWWAVAQNNPASGARTPLSLRDLPNMMVQFGRQRQLEATTGANATQSTQSNATAKGGGKAKAGRVAKAITSKNFALVEVDLTPGNISDEREPSVRPSGDFIAFASNGVDLVNNTTLVSGSDGKIDANNKGTHYHIWIMRRDGSGQRQVTGFSIDAGRNQRHPSWSPDGNRLVYVDGDGTAAQLFFTSPFTSDPITSRPPIQQITFFAGAKRDPAWGPAGSIAFASNVVAAQNGTSTPTPNNNYDVFTIDSAGSLVTLRRLTGGANDTVGDSTDDWNPEFSLLNVGVLFFSSNRDANGPLTAGRRIWSMGAVSGAFKRQITDPTTQPGGVASDIDDYPTSSLSQAFTVAGQNVNFTEKLAFESNRLVDTTDTTRDLNVFSMPIDSDILAPPPTPPAGALTVSSFTDDQVRDYDNVTGTFRRDFTGALLSSPEDVLYGPDLTGDGFQDLYVANRIRNAFGTIEVYNGVTGVFFETIVRGTGPASGNTPGNGLDEPTGLAVGPTGALFVASSGTNTILRVNLPGRGLTIFAQTTITGGIEGITFGPDANGDSFSDLYVTAPFNNRIDVFNGITGAFLRPFVDNTSGGNLNLPVGVAFGPDRNGDGIAELYVVCDGFNGAIKIYSGQALANQPTQFLADLVTRTTDPTLNRPQRLVFGSDVTGDGIPEVYVSIFNNGVGPLRVNRYDGATGAFLPAVGQLGSTFILDPLLSGANGLAFNPVAAGTYTPPTANAPPIETATNPAFLETNLFSSPTGVTNGTFPGATEDRSADREPSFARSNATSTTVAQVVFASQRRTASAPSTDPANPAPVVVNPGGGAQFTATIPPRPTTFTHDIWTTTVQDFTPPILIPVAVGGQLYPAVAPGVQAPFTAPRTAEEGLLPGSKVSIAFVIQDLESGLASASVVFKDADRPTFTTSVSDVDYENPGDAYPVEIAIEGQPQTVTSFNSVNGQSLALRIFDDGPIEAGGNERQQNAIAGDGTYYAEGSFATTDNSGAPLTGDYYIDLAVADNIGNDFLYDNVYGFSTRAFARNNKVLFVSDYTVGQTFPAILSGLAPRSSIPSPPVESYFLTNPGGTARPPLTDHPPPADLSVPFTGAPDTTSLGTLNTDPVTGEGDWVDNWRILSRGPVTREVLSLYSPQITEQLQPGIDPDDDGIPGPYRNTDGTPITRQTAVASTCVVWGAPYTGNVFATPGTLYDGATQRDLTAFLETGGRLFVTGQEVAFALSNNGTVSNGFLNNELKANFTGEVFTAPRGPQNVLNGTNDPLIVNGTAAGIDPPADVYIFSGQDGATYADAAHNQQGMDRFTSIGAGAGETVTALYNYNGGGVAGHRVEKTRPSGIESRLVFFGFGYEAVHRRYRRRNDPNPFYDRCLNFRAKIFYNMTRIYFYTGGISGQVISAATNQPIPNFIIEVVDGSGNQIFVGETDENGQYEILGMPYGSYTVRPLQYNDNGVIRSGNGSYFPGPAQGAFVTGGEISRDENFRVQPAPPGSISGRAINDKGTVNVSDDATPAVTPAVGVPVLIRSIRELPRSASFPQGGIFAAITVTDGAGRFTIRNVPSNEIYELIFNPRPGFTNATNPRLRGDIPPDSGVIYPNPDPTASPQPNLQYGRRVIPVDPNYGLDFAHPSIRQAADPTGALRPGFLIPIGENLDIGDVPIPPGNGPGGGEDPTTPPPTPTDEFVVGSVYMISIPYMDAAALTSTTTPERAFTLPPIDPVTNAVNYRLSKFDATKQQYVALSTGAILQRGEGYFLRPVTRGVSLRRPPDSPPRVALPATVDTFTITLRRSASLAPTDPNNGFNLIGFPFNPGVYRSSDWNVASVFVPATGARYNSLTAAAAAGVVSSTLFTLSDTSGAGYTNTSTLVPFKGYFAKTYVDNVQVTLVASNR